MISGEEMDNFTLTYDGFTPGQEALREALTSTGNGYFCTRGAAEWQDADEVHYAGTYAHGCYNRETTILGGRPVSERGSRKPAQLAGVEVADRRRGGDSVQQRRVCSTIAIRYDIRDALVSRELRFRDRAGRVTTLRSRRFVSMAHVHQAAIEWTLVPENWSGSVDVVSAIDARVTNANVARYRQLEGRHLDPVSPRTFGPEVIALRARTRQSRV